MKILITNDDGITSDGLKLLVSKARKYGEIIIIAPENEQSGKSQSIEIKKGMKIKENFLYEGIKAYQITASPADCVRFAKYGLHLDFDIVFSGINRGYNLGDDIMYSGTVGAASEAVLMGKKAIAFSSYRQGFVGIEKYFDEIMKYFFDNKLLDKGNFYNVNVGEEVKGIKITRQGYTHFNTYFEEKDGEFYQKGNHNFELERSKTQSDVFAITEGLVSITPLTVDRTDVTLYNSLINEK